MNQLDGAAFIHQGEEASLPITAPGHHPCSGTARAKVRGPGLGQIDMGPAAARRCGALDSKRRA